MSLFVTNEMAKDPLTGIPVQLGFVIMCENGDLMSTSPTGEPRYGRNTLPGTDPNFPTVTKRLGPTNLLGTTDPHMPIPVPGGPLDTEALGMLLTEVGGIIELEPTNAFGALAILETEMGVELILNPTTISTTIIGLPYGFVAVPSTGVIY